MADRFSKEARSRIMASIRGLDTQPELEVRRRLFACGFRFRLHVKALPGTPDVVLSCHRVAVFVNGCFWHGHDCPKGRNRPQTNSEFWNAKIARNVARDRQATRNLRKMGWCVYTLWECRLEAGLGRLLRRLSRQ